MGFFRRSTQDTSAGPDPATSATDEEATELAATTESDESERAESAESTGPSVSRAGGPFDRSEVEGLDGRLDLGALWVTGQPGMELRLEVDEESQNVVGVTAVLKESAVQLQAFAAPRSEGVWDDIRTEIAAGITSQGGTADKADGPLGTELRAQMPGQGANGRTVFSPVRFIGVDGPRWFLRAVLSGPAAVDEDAALALLDVVRATVVVRGGEAMAPRELLPLKLPEQVDAANQDMTGHDAAGHDAAGHDAAGTAGDDTARTAPSLDDFRPFERGPEITEIH